jgi:3-dehydroquinate synthase
MTMSDRATPTETIAVSLGNRSYDILIGSDLLPQAGALISPLLRRPRCAIVTDDIVGDLHLSTLEAGLAASGIASSSKRLPAGEATKSFDRLRELCAWLLDEKIERQDLIIALGGGVIGDLTGFAAAILRRGTRFVQIPTTLLAQVDSSVGGKTGINVDHGKNLIGAFHQPDLVLADQTVLTSLPARDLAAGYAEVVKYAALGDAAFFTWLETHGGDVLAREPAALTHAVKRSCEMKADIVARDETEQGDRALLNLGHTFGHAFEALMGYGDALLHGEAVALGMVLAAKLSRDLDLCSDADVQRLARLLDASKLPTEIKDIGEFSAAALIDVMQQDKKVEAGTMRFILMRGLGASFISRDVTPDLLKSFLTREGAKA